MTTEEMERAITERVLEMVNDPKIQQCAMRKLTNGETKADVEKWVMMCAIGTLMGIQKMM